MEVVGQLHAPAAVAPEKEPSASSALEAGRSQTDLQNSVLAVTRSPHFVALVHIPRTDSCHCHSSKLQQSVERSYQLRPSPGHSVMAAA